ncbi:MAG TPA: hypothetical protein PKI32_07470, partial [Opitutales bacterium]|nr:hypothetical protein [Opitutales bacterium]
MHEIEQIRRTPLKAYLVEIRENGMEDSPEALLEELRELAGNLGIETLGSEIVNVRTPTPRYYIGSGKAEEIKLSAQEVGAEVVIFDASLAP